MNLYFYLTERHAWIEISNIFLIIKIPTYLVRTYQGKMGKWGYAWVKIDNYLRM